MTDRPFLNTAMTIAAALFAFAALTAFSVLPGGCGKSGGASTPEAAAKAFVAALQAGDYAKAADMMAWDDIARQQNPDWDSFPSSQRSLIISKLKQQMQGSLSQLASRIGSAQVQNVNTSGTTAVATVGNVTINLQQRDGRWLILGFR